MYRGLAFYLAPTLPSEEKTELKRLIRQNEGVVSNSPKGATELVAYDTLDARHGNRISTDFITDSVAFRVLQDPAKYSGKIFTAAVERRRGQKRGERLEYTLEDDARMLHFACTRDWKAMTSVNTWKLAEEEEVTPHSAESMREHFRKQLMMKTPVEQRILMAKAAATTRARLLEQEDEAEDEQEIQRQEPSPNTRRLTLTGLTTVEEAMEVEGQKSSRRRTRSRKQTTPLQISQRIRASEGDHNESTTSPVHVSTSVTATPTTPTSWPTPAVSARSDPSTGEQSAKKKQKRKKDTPPSRIPSLESRSSLQETVESDSEGEGRETGGVYFTSAWTTTVNDRNKRPLLQQFFASPSGAESISSEQIDDASIAGQEEDDNSESSSGPLQPEVQEATEEDTDAIICQLQLDTDQDLQAVVHALYYFSGDVEKAKQFLKGASPSDIWCPEDDLLLSNLVAEGKVDLSSVDEALASGAFASLQKPRDSAAIWKRVQFLK